MKRYLWPLATLALFAIAIGGLPNARLHEDAAERCIAQVQTSEERARDETRRAADKALGRDEERVRELVAMRNALLGLATAWRVDIAEADAP